MANNYLQFSEAIGHLSIEERDWLQRQLETVCVFGDHEYAEDEMPDDLSTADATWCGCRAFRDLPDVDSDDDAGFQYEFWRRRATRPASLGLRRRGRRSRSGRAFGAEVPAPVSAP